MSNQTSPNKTDSNQLSQADNRVTGGAVNEQGTEELLGYTPGKEERSVRRKVYERFYFMRDHPDRKLAEEDWERGEELFGQVIPTPEDDDWRAHLVLPDAFSAVQAHMQETIERNSRPYLRRIEDSDKGIETFQNAVMTYNLNRTNFDFQYFLAKYVAAIKGTAFLKDYYRVDKRTIKDPTSVNTDGTLIYTDKELTDFDDDFCEWIPTELIYVDPGAKDCDEWLDLVEREIVDIDEFRRKYGFRKDFMNLSLVHRGGETTVNSPIFAFPHDLNENQVELLHYYNRPNDEYHVVANNVVVRMGPLPNKHKEIPYAPVYHYRMPGLFYGWGVPRIIDALTQERASLRNLNLDRAKMNIQKVFLVNDQMDIDDEEAVVAPHRMINVDTNGMSIRDAIQPLEFGDTPASHFKTEETLQEDIRRATGIDDRIEGVQAGGTATEASFLRESSQKRINLIAKLSEMDTIKRIGKLKWSNIQFFYPAPRVERVTEDNDEREQKTYKKIQVDGQDFTIIKGDDGKSTLQVNEMEGSSTFTLNKSMARFMEGDTDVVIDAESITVVSKALKQAKTSEMLATITAVPTFLAELDARKSLTQILEVNDFQAKDWLKGDGKSDSDWKELAEWENLVMSKGVVLSPTEDAPDVHTEGHLDYTKSVDYQSLDDHIKAIFMQHITGEHDQNPATGASADLMGPPQGPPELGGPPGVGTSNLQGPQNPNIQPADLTPSTVTGEQPNSSTNTNQPL